ncbi:MAG TPA: hypothetical protein VFR79_10680 [Nitrospira sp.]|nr:hypothetical protein [Nitrospira sp.]
MANHRNYRWRILDVDVPDRFESMSLVQREVYGIRRLQIGALSLTVNAFQSVA